MRLLKMQGIVRSNLVAFIEHRGAMRGDAEAEEGDQERTPPPPNGDKTRFKNAIGHIARTFADGHKTQELLGRLGYDRRSSLAC